MGKSRNDKNILIEHLYEVLNTEMAKPYEEIDAELIEACVELILELQGKNFTLSNEEIENLVRKIPFIEVADFEAARKKRKKINKKKILLIAAIIAILCAIMAIMSSGDEWDEAGYFIDRYGDLDNIPHYEPINVNGFEYTFIESSSNYTDPKEFCEKEDVHNLLFPTELPEGVHFEFICKTKELDKDVVIIYLPGIEGFCIELDSEIPQIAKDRADKTYTTEKGIVCYIHYTEHPDGACYIQIEFEHDGNYYVATGTDNEQTLLDIIESLEEIE